MNDDISDFEQIDNNSCDDKIEKFLLSIDPGKDKCGMAILGYDLKILYKGIIKTIEIKSYLQKVLNNYIIKDIVIGNGTYSSNLNDILKEISEIPVSIVDEAYTTVEAEERYLAKHKSTWQNWLPFISWKPSAAVDDYVAIILAERFMKK